MPRCSTIVVQLFNWLEGYEVHAAILFNPRQAEFVQRTFLMPRPRKINKEKILATRVPTHWWDIIHQHAESQDSTLSKEVRSWIEAAASARGLDLTASLPK